MKKIISLFIVFVTISTGFNIYAAEETFYYTLYVAQTGNDSNDGSQDQPFRTIEKAQEKVRELSDGMTGDILVHIGEGTYFLDKNLEFGTTDSGKNGHRIIWQGEGDGKTVISGGQVISGFQKSASDEGVWEADAPDFDAILQLSVNGKRRYVAKNPTQITGMRKSSMVDNEDWYAKYPNDARDDHYNFYDPATPYTYDGMYLSKRDFGMYENPSDILFKWEHEWTTAIVPVKEIEQDPNVQDYLRVRMQPGFYNYLVQGGRVYPNPAREFMVMNAMELLDEPGEFYFNRTTKKLYYLPLEGENMNEAVVIAPKLENLITVIGNDVDDKVCNIDFCGISFSDTKWDYMRGIMGDQALGASSYRISVRGFRAVDVFYAKNVNFTGNIFSNIGGTAISLVNACEDCNISGNVFYDIGESGIGIGQQNQGDISVGEDGMSIPVPDVHKNDPYELVGSNQTRIDASVYSENRNDTELKYGNAFMAFLYPGFPHPDNNDGEGHFNVINKSWFDDESLQAKNNAIPYKSKWQDTQSVKENEKAWVKFEFYKPYSLEEIILSFDPACVTAEEKSDFEILASNDIAFYDYDVLETVSGAAPSDINRYAVGSDKKYQYVMVRTSRPKVFALSRVWITTRDIKPNVKLQRCKGITIENNYMERIGVDAARSVGLVVMHGEDFKITHNEIRDVGYSGMSIGWSWNTDFNTCYNMEVANNYIFDVAQASHDGGGIYVLGPQPGSIYHNNYINGVNQALHAFYTDNGSRYETITENVIVGGSYILSPYVATDYAGKIMDCIFKDNYANQSKSNTAGAMYNRYEPQKLYPMGQPQDAVSYATITDAGLEKEYAHLRSLVPRQRDNLPYKYELNYAAMRGERASFSGDTKAALEETLRYTSENASFGSGLGMIPYAYKDRLDQMIDYYAGNGNSDIYMCHTAARELEYEMQAALNRHSFEETLQMCEEKLAFAKERIAPAAGMGTCEKYPAAAVDEFESLLNEVKLKITEDMQTKEKYPLLRRLETGYNKLEDARYMAEIEYVYADGAVKTEIDPKKRIVLLYMPAECGTVVSGLSVKVSSGAVLAKKMESTIDLSQPLQVPVYCKGNGRYKIWTFVLEPYRPEDVYNLGAAAWRVGTAEKDMIRRFMDGVCLPAGEYIYMADGYSHEENGGEINFRPLTQNSINTFKLILGADTPFGQENSSTVQSRCEIEFKDDAASFYKVINGSRKLITTVQNTGIEYNQRNNLQYEIEEINNNLYFKITLNGKIILSPVVEKYSYGRFLGVYTRHMSMKIYYQ